MKFVKFVKFIITIYLKLRIGVLGLLQCILAAKFCLGAIETMHPASQDSRKQVRHAREEAWSDCAFPKAFWENSPLRAMSLPRASTPNFTQKFKSM